MTTELFFYGSPPIKLEHSQRFCDTDLAWIDRDGDDKRTPVEVVDGPDNFLIGIPLVFEAHGIYTGTINGVFLFEQHKIQGIDKIVHSVDLPGSFSSPSSSDHVFTLFIGF